MDFKRPYKWRKDHLGVFSASPARAGRKSLPFLHIFPSIAVIRTWILIRLKVSQLLQLHVLLLRPTPRTRPTIRNPTIINQAFISIRNILIASLVLTYSRFQVGIKTLACQADRAPARSVTPGDCPSDCIGARALHV